MKEEIKSEQADIETSSDDYATRFSGIIGEYFLDVQKKITLELLEDENVKTILDVGGGHAQLAIPLLKKNYKVTVTGSNSDCKKRIEYYVDNGQCKFKECNFLSLPFDDQSFDAVICFRLLTHEKNWKILIEEMCRVSKKVIIVDYPDKRSFNILYDFLFSFKKKYEKNTRTFYSFSREQLKQSFNRNNFNVFIFRPQFFVPMVFHRLIKNVKLSKIMEKIAQILGLKYLFGSPVILKIKNTDK